MRLTACRTSFIILYVLAGTHSLLAVCSAEFQRGDACADRPRSGLVIICLCVCACFFFLWTSRCICIRCMVRAMCLCNKYWYPGRWTRCRHTRGLGHWALVSPDLLDDVSCTSHLIPRHIPDASCAFVYRIYSYFREIAL